MAGFRGDSQCSALQGLFVPDGVLEVLWNRENDAMLAGRSLFQQARDVFGAPPVIRNAKALESLVRLMDYLDVTSDSQLTAEESRLLPGVSVTTLMKVSTLANTGIDNSSQARGEFFKVLAYLQEAWAQNFINSKVFLNKMFPDIKEAWLDSIVDSLSLNDHLLTNVTGNREVLNQLQRLSRLSPSLDISGQNLAAILQNPSQENALKAFGFPDSCGAIVFNDPYKLREIDTDEDPRRHALRVLKYVHQNKAYFDLIRGEQLDATGIKARVEKYTAVSPALGLINNIPAGGASLLSFHLANPGTLKGLFSTDEEVAACLFNHDQDQILLPKDLMRVILNAETGSANSLSELHRSSFGRDVVSGDENVFLYANFLAALTERISAELKDLGLSEQEILSLKLVITKRLEQALGNAGEPSEIAKILFTEGKYGDLVNQSRELLGGTDPLFTAGVKAFLTASVPAASTPVSTEPDAPLKAFLKEFSCGGQEPTADFVAMVKETHLAAADGNVPDLLEYRTVFTPVRADLSFMHKAYQIADKTLASGTDMSAEAKTELEKFVLEFVTNRAALGAPDDNIIAAMQAHFSEKYLKDFDPSKSGVWKDLWVDIAQKSAELEVACDRCVANLGVIERSGSRLIEDERKQELLREGLDRDITHSVLHVSDSGSAFWSTPAYKLDALANGVGASALSSKAVSVDDALQVAINVSSVVALAHPVWAKKDNNKENIQDFFYALFSGKLDPALFKRDEDAQKIRELLVEIESLKRDLLGAGGDLKSQIAAVQEKLATCSAYEEWAEIGGALAQAASSNGIYLPGVTSKIVFSQEGIEQGWAPDLQSGLEKFSDSVHGREDTLSVKEADGSIVIKDHQRQWTATVATDGSSMTIEKAAMNSRVAKESMKRLCPQAGRVANDVTTNRRDEYQNMFALLKNASATLSAALIKTMKTESPSIRLQELQSFCVAQIKAMTQADSGSWREVKEGPCSKRAADWLQAFVGNDAKLAEEFIKAAGLKLVSTMVIGFKPVTPTTPTTLPVPPVSAPGPAVGSAATGRAPPAQQNHAAPMRGNSTASLFSQASGGSDAFSDSSAGQTTPRSGHQ